MLNSTVASNECYVDPFRIVIVLTDRDERR